VYHPGSKKHGNTLVMGGVANDYQGGVYGHQSDASERIEHQKDCENYRSSSGDCETSSGKQLISGVPQGWQKKKHPGFLS
jgi:hypothetical protein